MVDSSQLLQEYLLVSGGSFRKEGIVKVVCFNLKSKHEKQNKDLKKEDINNWMK